MSDDSMIHYWKLSEPGDMSPCGINLAASSNTFSAEDWPEVTCAACKVYEPGAWPPSLAAGSPERREQMIAQCESIERECAEQERLLAETRERAVRLRHFLMRLSAREAAQGGPAAWLGTLKGYATAQRVAAAAAGALEPHTREQAEAAQRMLELPEFGAKPHPY